MKKPLVVLISMTILAVPLVPVLGADATLGADAPAAASSGPYMATTSTGTDPVTVSKSAGAATATSNFTRVSGVVSSVEDTKSQLHVTDVNGNSTNVNVTGNTLVRKNGRTVKYSDVQPGDKVLLINKSTTTVTP